MKQIAGQGHIQLHIHNPAYKTACSRSPVRDTYNYIYTTLPTRPHVADRWSGTHTNDYYTTLPTRPHEADRRTGTHTITQPCLQDHYAEFKIINLLCMAIGAGQNPFCVAVLNLYRYLLLHMTKSI